MQNDTMVIPEFSLPIAASESVRSGRVIRLELEDPWSPRPVSELPEKDIPKFLHKVDEAETV